MGDTILASLILPERKSADSGSLKSALTIGAGRSSRPGSCLVECKRRKGCTLYTTHRDNMSTRYLLLFTTSPHFVLPHDLEYQDLSYHYNHHHHENHHYDHHHYDHHVQDPRTSSLGSCVHCSRCASFSILCRTDLVSQIGQVNHGVLQYVDRNALVTKWSLKVPI